MVRAYDILSGRLVRIFNERSAPRQALRHILTGQADADEEAKWSVSQIVASREGFVASIGARILAWRAGDDHKARKKTPRSGGRLSSRAERFRTEMEMQQDIRESTAVLDHEHQDRMSRLSEYRDTQSFAGIPKSLGDMTDEEAVRRTCCSRIHIGLGADKLFTVRFGYDDESRGGRTETAGIGARHVN